jgi:hypothetical protein
MFESGCVKLLSGDSNWRHLTALNFHYETQPLPTWIGWFAHQWPAWFQRDSAAVMFGIELVLPFFIFAPRRLRFVACAGFIFLQTCILLTGNYCFFNYLTIALAVLLLDDAALRWWIPVKWARALGGAAEPNADSVGCAIPTPGPPSESANRAPNDSTSTHERSRAGVRSWPMWITAPVGVLVVSASLPHLSAMFGASPPWLSPAAAVAEWLAPFRTVNSYGLFAVMTTSRPEIVIEGSNDSQNWRAYEFRYKPGALKRRPSFVAPHQPRLDWQMWFAALGDYRQNPWLVNLCVRLLQGSPEVLRLLETNPFAGKPPRYIRAVVYDYHFTNSAQRHKTGAWWTHEFKGIYLPVISLGANQGRP